MSKKLKRGILISSLVVLMIIAGGIIYKTDLVFANNNINQKVEGVYDVKIEKTAQWEEGSRFGYVLKVDIKNISGKQINDWNLTMKFPESSEVTELWCADHTFDKGVLTIKPNGDGKIIAEDTTRSLGFTIYSDSKISLKDIEITSDAVTSTEN